MRINRGVYEKYVTSYSPGKVIFEEGDPGMEMFIIIQGEVEIRKRTSSTASKTLIVFHKGDIFGEMAIIEKKPRSASAIATVATKVLVMNEKLFESIIGTNPDFAKKIIRMMAERLRKANSIIQAMTQTNRQNQIMNSLVKFAEEHGISTFKGKRVNLDSFVNWVETHLGIRAKDVKVIIQSLLKQGMVKQSVRGKDEIIVDERSASFVQG